MKSKQPATRAAKQPKNTKNSGQRVKTGVKAGGMIIIDK